MWNFNFGRSENGNWVPKTRSSGSFSLIWSAMWAISSFSVFLVFTLTLPFALDEVNYPSLRYLQDGKMLKWRMKSKIHTSNNFLDRKITENSLKEQRRTRKDTRESVDGKLNRFACNERRRRVSEWNARMKTKHKQAIRMNDTKAKLNIIMLHFIRVGWWRERTSTTTAAVSRAGELQFRVFLLTKTKKRRNRGKR